jgi:hypothetical protein
MRTDPFKGSEPILAVSNGPFRANSGRKLTQGYAFLATSGHRLAKPKPRSSSGRMTGTKHIRNPGP